MHRTERPLPMFVGESTALDFLNSTAKPRSIEFDWLETGSDLLDWLVAAGLCEEAEIRNLRTPHHEAGLTSALRNIHEFRDEFRVFIQSVSETSTVAPAHPMIKRINDLLKKGGQHMCIDTASSDEADLSKSKKPFDLKSIHVLQTPDMLLPRIAAACAKLICEADFRYIRNCEGSTCTIYFLDISKNHKRRWCSMDLCGNRAKAAAHRKK